MVWLPLCILSFSDNHIINYIVTAHGGLIYSHYMETYKFVMETHNMQSLRTLPVSCPTSLFSVLPNRHSMLSYVGCRKMASYRFVK